MLYREAGQFKTTYGADQQIFPILQDRLFVLAVILAAFLVVPLFASQYLYTEILIPFLILSLAAIGLNILVGYCGQVSLGTGGFMAVGAYAAYNLWLRVPELNNLVIVFLFGGLMAAAVGILFGLPSLRIKGFYLAVATLASQFFLDWLFARVKWLTNYTPSGSVAVGETSAFGWKIDTPAERYLFILAFVVVATLVAKNLVRGHIGRSWMAIRDMDIAAEIIGFRPLRTKLTAFAVSSFFILFMVIIGGLGSLIGSFFGAALIFMMPIALGTILPALLRPFGVSIGADTIEHLRFMIVGALIIFFLIVEPHGLARLWQIAKQKLRVWPFPY